MSEVEQALFELRRAAGFEPEIGFIESVDMCLWLLAKVHDAEARGKCARQFRRMLRNLPQPEYPH